MHPAAKSEKLYGDSKILFGFRYKICAKYV